MDQLRRTFNIPCLMEIDQTLLEREKKYFAAEFSHEQEKLRLKREKEEQERNTKVSGFHPLLL
jgi:hypothetical protein